MAFFSRVVAAVRQPSARMSVQFLAKAKPAARHAAAAPRHAGVLCDVRPAWGTNAQPVPAVSPALAAPVCVQHGTFSRAPQLLASVGAVLVDVSSDGDSDGDTNADADAAPGAFARRRLPSVVVLGVACRALALRCAARHDATIAPPPAPLTCAPLFHGT